MARLLPVHLFCKYRRRAFSILVVPVCLLLEYNFKEVIFENGNDCYYGQFCMYPVSLSASNPTAPPAACWMQVGERDHARGLYIHLL
jgi:hypothetical protein